MGEWKRVLLDPKRLVILLLMTLVCAGLFVLSLLDEIGPQGLSTMGEASAYAEGLVERWEGKDLSELSGLVKEELWKLDAFEGWYSGYGDAFVTEEAAYASIADLPALGDAAKSADGAAFYRIFSAYRRVLVTMLGETDYLSGYPEYLDGVQTQAETQSQSSIFGKPGSFSRRNLAKTAREFDTLRGVEVAFGSNRGLENWLAFDTGDYFHLVAMVLIVFAFLEERRRGLWPVVRATRGGRAKLGLSRIGILCAASVLATVLFHVLPFVLSLGIDGGWSGLGRALQSLESFRTCTLHVSIAQWLCIYLAVKILSGLLIGLLLWCILGRISNVQFSLSVLGAVLVGEYLLYALLPVQSGWNVFKYFNLFTYVHTASLYTEYLNVDLFGFPVGIRELAFVTLAVLGTSLAAAAVLMQRNRRPEGNRDVLGRLSLLWNRGMDVFRTRFSLGMWETYKAGVFQYGVLILLIVLFVGSRLFFVSYDSSPENGWYLSYVHDIEGPITQSVDAYLESAERNIPEGAEDAADLHSALSRLEWQIETLRGRAAERGYQPWLLDDTGYRMIYGPDSRDLQRLNAAAAMLLLIFCCGGLAAFERQSGTVPMLRATKRGRKGIFRRKLLLTALLAVFVWAAVYAGEVRTLVNNFHPTPFAAPVQNIDALARFPIVLTVAQYLALLYGVRLLMLFGVGIGALLISHYAPGVQTAYLMSAGILGLPALLAVLGVDLMKWISPLVPVASAELFWGMGSGSFLYLLPFLAWLTVSGAALWFCRRKWI